MLTGGYFADMSEQIEATWKLDGISPKAYQHPGDRAATAALAKVPYLDEVVRRLVALGYGVMFITHDDEFAGRIDHRPLRISNETVMA